MNGALCIRKCFRVNTMGKIRITRMEAKSGEMNTNGHNVDSELITSFRPKVIKGLNLDQKSALAISMNEGDKPVVMCGGFDILDATTKNALRVVMDKLRTEDTLEKNMFFRYLDELAESMGLS